MGSDTCSHQQYGNESLKHWEHALAFVSICILCAFLIENLVHMYILRIMYFKEGPLVLDLFVIVVSLVLEIVALKIPMLASGLVIGARIWRFARVGHGALETKHGIEEVTGKVHPGTCVGRIHEVPDGPSGSERQVVE